VECLVERCAGLDIGKADLKACVRIPGVGGRRRQETRTFATTTGALLGLREWLVEQQATRVSQISAHLGERGFGRGRRGGRRVAGRRR
jgi:hypothetical protein